MAGTGSVVLMKTDNIIDNFVYRKGCYSNWLPTCISHFLLIITDK